MHNDEGVNSVHPVQRVEPLPVMYAPEVQPEHNLQAVQTVDGMY